MKRHPSLIPLSHDHHHALVEARRLRRAAEAGDDERRAAVAEFLRFFSSETIRHFRTEEELVFPLLVGQDGDGSELLVRALLEHQRIHALAARSSASTSAIPRRSRAFRASGGSTSWPTRSCKPTLSRST
jgi:iron-sulfur cluster repair protein YtfE (RIC family)